MDQADAANVNVDLLQALKRRRTDIAKERDVPPYVVFSDKTLIDMANKKPTDRDSFLDVHGVGASKAEQFAEDFLAVLADFQD